MIYLSQFNHLLFVGCNQWIFIVNLNSFETDEICGWQPFNQQRITGIHCLPDANLIWTFSNNLIKVWKVSENRDVQLIKEFTSAHHSKITAFSTIKLIEQFYTSSVKSPFSPYQIWTASFDGQLLDWDSKHLVAVNEWFVDDKKNSIINICQLSPTWCLVLSIFTHTDPASNAITELTKLIIYDTSDLQLSGI